MAYLIEKYLGAGIESDRQGTGGACCGKQVLVVRMNKNKKFQKEKLTAEGYKDIVEFFTKTDPEMI